MIDIKKDQSFIEPFEIQKAPGKKLPGAKNRLEKELFIPPFL